MAPRGWRRLVAAVTTAAAIRAAAVQRCARSSVGEGASRACTDADGRKLGREVFKDKAPASVGVGKWNSGPLGVSRGYHPPAHTLTVADLPCEKGRRRTYDNNK